MLALPEVEVERLDAVRGIPVTAVQLCAMRDCGEEFDQPPRSGLFCVTWGAVLHLRSQLLAISWSEDSIGDPCRIGLVDPIEFLAIESLVAQDVSALPPWSRYIGCDLDSYEVLTYQSNYAREPSSTKWHAVPWGLLLHLGPHSLLAAAVDHENPLGGSLCADELVLAFSDFAIHRLSDVYEGERGEWSAG